MALPMPKLWTPEEYDALPADGVRRELIEGVLWVAPSPDESHQTLAALLTAALRRQLPRDDFRATQGVEIMLKPSLRYIPDVQVVYAHAPRSHQYEAYHVAVVVEIESQATSMDRVTKPAHYAMAGIPWYWRIERGAKPKLVAYELVPGGSVYAPVGEFIDLVRLDAPAPVEFSLIEMLD